MIWGGGGWQTAVRAAAARERYADMAEVGGPDEGGLPPFHHGSHYSTAGHILHYLVRPPSPVPLLRLPPLRHG